jgi:hypothetical protein
METVYGGIMKRFALLIALTAWMAGITLGAYTTFEFHAGATLRTGDTSISGYMSGVHGSSFGVGDYEVTEHVTSVNEAWMGSTSKLVRQHHDPRRWPNDLGILFEDNALRALPSASHPELFPESSGFELRIKAASVAYARDGRTLSHPDRVVRDFVVEMASRADVSETDVRWAIRR